jgi:S1-C subfamily serine protease
MKNKFAIPAVAVSLVLSLAACSSTARSASSATTTTTASSAPALNLDQLPGLVARAQPTVVTVVTNLGEGSGIIWSSDGTIVTNNHVIANATSIAVQFADGQHVTATLRAGDPYSDTALINVARTNLPVAKWAAGTAPVGTFVVALGSPLGLTESASIGIVSGSGRNVPGAPGTPPIADLLQTSAPISPGNSGGALVDDRGNVVGMTEAYLPPSTGAVSIGLAIPAPTVVSSVKQLLATGSVKHPYIGLTTQTLTPDIAKQLGTSASTGAMVVVVSPGGPAATAGLRPGDVVIQLDATPVQSADDLVLAVREHQPGDVATLRLVRNDATIVTKVVLAARAT